MQRLTVSLIVAFVLTGCWAIPYGISDSVTSLDSLDSFEPATGHESDASGATDGSEPTSEGGTEETGVVECVPTELPEAAPGYWPRRIASGADGTLYVAGIYGLAVTTAAILPHDAPAGTGRYVAAFAQDGECVGFWALPGGYLSDVAVDGERVVAVGSLDGRAHLAVFDTKLEPVLIDSLPDGDVAYSVAAAGGGRWAVVGSCTEGTLYAEYAPDQDLVTECHSIGDKSLAHGVVVDVPGSTVYVVGHYTGASALPPGLSVAGNFDVWLASLPLTPGVEPGDHFKQAKWRQVPANVTSADYPGITRLGLTTDRIFVAYSSRSKPLVFPTSGTPGECLAVVGWLPRQADLSGDGDALWLDPEGDVCNLAIDDMRPEGGGVLIGGHTSRNFVDSTGYEYLKDRLRKGFTAHVKSVADDIVYHWTPVADTMGAGNALIVRQCDGSAISAYLAGPEDPEGTKFFAGSFMDFWAPPL